MIISMDKYCMVAMVGV